MPEEVEPGNHSDDPIDPPAPGELPLPMRAVASGPIAGEGRMDIVTAAPMLAGLGPIT